MKFKFKWLGIAAAALVILVLLVAAGLYLYGTYQLERTYTFPVERVSLPSDPSARSRGQHLAILHCATCHGGNLAGTVVFQDPSLGLITAPNLTPGQGGLGTLSDADYVRAIRHGVGRDGRALITMPSSSFYYMSDEDLGALIAYLKTVPAVDRDVSDRVVTTPLARILMGAGAFGDIFTAAEIDHTGPRPTPPPPGRTVAYGDYLVRVGECRTCHGENLTGGKDPDPHAPPAPSLTQAGELRAWSEADFVKALRTGTTPSGRHMSEFMPWKYLSQMTDDELGAVWMYLQTLQPATR